MKRGFNYRKATQALNFFANKEGGSINKMKALKLLWLADRLHLRKYGRTITNDRYLAMKNGPVASSTKDIAESSSFSSEEERVYGHNYIRLNGRDEYFIDSVGPIDSKVFSKTDIEVLGKICENFGHKDQFELSDISHLYPEWKRWESKLLAKIGSRFDMEYLDFFDNPSNGNHPLFDGEDEMLQLSKEIFSKC